jgi:hypothetical protein
MASQSSPWTARLINSGLLLCGIVVLVLIYAFGTHLTASDISPYRGHNPAHLLGEVVQVEVHNGCGKADAAARATSYLREFGFDVVAHGNYSSFDRDSTVIIDRVGNLQAARKVATALGLSHDHVRQQLDSTRYLDVSVVIGHDYPQMRPFRN